MTASYEKAGVSVDKANDAEQSIAKIANKTFNKNVLLGVGAFSACLDVSFLKKYKNPALFVTIDGAGTKTKIAAMSGKWHGIGEDVVNHCSNDLLCSGAKPLFFVDYLASSKIDVKVVSEIVKGMAFACKELSCPLVGGETAEMPGVYLENETDVVGCMAGVGEKMEMFNPQKIVKGDLLVGLVSDGLHTNGYSLARKILLEKHSLEEKISGLEKTLGEELLRPHKSYSKNIFSLMKKVPVKGIAHITGGGLLENVPRVLPENRSFVLDEGSWQMPEIFRLIQKEGNVPDYEMFHTFNMGIGLVLVVSKKDATKTLKELSRLSEESNVVGKIV